MKWNAFKSESTNNDFQKSQKSKIVCVRNETLLWDYLIVKKYCYPSNTTEQYNKGDFWS